MKPNYVIFTDGSVRRWTDERNKEKYCGAYGVAVLDLATMRYTKFGGQLRTRSSVYAEVWAIYRGLQYLNTICKRTSQKPKALVITDSKVNVNVLTTYIQNSWNLDDWNQWLKCDGTPVKNQEIYRNIVTLIAENNMNIRIAHINSHMKPTKSNIKQSIERLRAVGITVNDGTMKIFIKLNAEADEYATNTTQAIRDKGDMPFLQNKAKLVWESLKDGVL